MTDTTRPTSILRPLVEELHERRERAKQGGGEELDRAQVEPRVPDP